jgi:hypothetical protein
VYKGVEMEENSPDPEIRKRIFGRRRAKVKKTEPTPPAQPDQSPPESATPSAL